MGKGNCGLLAQLHPAGLDMLHSQLATRPVQGLRLQNSGVNYLCAPIYCELPLHALRTLHMCSACVVHLCRGCVILQAKAPTMQRGRKHGTGKNDLQSQRKQGLEHGVCSAQAGDGSKAEAKAEW